ncbi:MAG: phosphatidate cytidylyltransferase [Lachnospiraceae bacterium]|nr:phosphatidate cytidylyltransferase [Lachnospiraceae bacterium]
MVKTRVISGIVVAASMLLFVWLGGVYLLALLLCVSLIGLFEFYRAVGLLKDGAKIGPVTGIGYAFTVLYYLFLFLFEDPLFGMMLACVLLVLVLLGTYVFTFPKYKAGTVVFAFYGFFYVSVMLSFIYLTRRLGEGIYIVWLIFFSSWFCDVFAYATGMLFGKHKLAPVLSPKKSVEGAVGGIAVPAVCGGIYGWLIGPYIDLGHPAAVFFVLCAAGAAVSQIGDLSASAVKRNYDIKDYGTLIPGHGGILDRFDSVIFTAPMIYFIAVFFIRYISS